MTTSLQVWINRTGAVRCTPQQREVIATLCLEAEERGDAINNVWHQSAKYFGHKCNCRACNP